MLARDAYLALSITTQYISSANALPAGPFTFASWIQLRDPAATNRPIFGSGTSGAPALRLNDTDRRLVLYKIGGSTIVSAPTPLPRVFEWVHVAATHDGTTAKLFVNGAMVAFAADTTAFTSATVRVGSDGVTNFSGRIDDSAVWARALSEEEVEAVFLVGPKGYPRTGLFFDYRYDDVSAVTIEDMSGGGNTGTPSATPAWTRNSYTHPKLLQRDMGLCITMNGTDESIGLPGALTQALGGAAGITIMGWARPLSPITSSRRIISLLSDTSNSAALIQTTPSGGNLFWETFGRSQGSDATETTTATGIDAPEHGRWAHVALVLDFAAPAYQFALNGIVVVKDTALAWSRSTFLGHSNGGFLGSGSASNYWSGQLDELQIFRRALSKAELRRGVLTGQWDDTDRMLLVDFDGGAIVDRSAYGHTLTLTNVDASNLSASLM